VVASEPAHVGLQFAARELGVGCDRVCEALGASVPIGSGDRIGYRGVVVELESFGLRERSLEVVVGDVRRDVEQCAVDRRDRDALMRRGVPGIEGTRTVQADPRDAMPGRRCGHLRARRVVLEKVPMRGRADVAEHRAVAVGHDRRQPPPLPRDRRATDRIDAAVQPAQAARLGPPLRRAGPDAKRLQLRERHHPPLPAGQLGQRHIGGCALLTTHRFA
jgi:hypothetical protein